MTDLGSSLRPRVGLVGALAGVTISLALATNALARDAVEATAAFTGPSAVRNLAYGDVLFHFYQNDYFGSLTRLSAAQALGKLGEQEQEAELLKGGLYLSLGQHVEAGKIFGRLLEGNVADDVRNRAWFYLAKVWYQRDYLMEAERALNSIRGDLAGPLQGERRLLHAQVLMYLERYEEAIRMLGEWDGADESTAYARFNLGVALVRAERMGDAAPLLDALGASPASNQEMAALRDKANLALGFAWLKAGRPSEARIVLERVRLEGPQSNKALLGAGWADSAEQRYREALVPWLELRGRDLLDAAVQEAHLAIPFAYARLSANRQAADGYVRAIDLFAQESARLDQSIASIRGGRLLEAVLENEAVDEQGWYWQMATLPDAAETRYLYHLLASNRFQEALKNYRDLQAMQRNLQSWSQSLSAFEDMVETRRLAYAQRLPRIEAVTSTIDLDALEARRNELDSLINRIESEDDVVGLATAPEQARWTILQRVEEELGRADPDDPLVEEMREKARMLRGVVYWELNTSYKARLWHERKQLRDLDVALKDTRRSRILVDRATNDSPRRTAEFAGRVEELSPRLVGLSARLAAAAATQANYLASVAIAELEVQKERLASYSTQAQFALASIYDSAGSSAVTTAEGVP